MSDRGPLLLELPVGQGRAVCARSGLIGGLRIFVIGRWVLSFEKITAAFGSAMWLRNTSALRRLALNLLRREKSEKRGVHVKRLKAPLDEKYLPKALNS